MAGKRSAKPAKSKSKSKSKAKATEMLRCYADTHRKLRLIRMLKGGTFAGLLDEMLAEPLAAELAKVPPSVRRLAGRGSE